MKIKLFSLVLLTAISSFTVQAQSSKNTDTDKKHSIRFTASDGLTLGGASIWGIGLSDALMGTQRSEQKATGVFGLGYRYQIRRFRLGLDVGVAQVSSDMTLSGDKSRSIKEKELNFLVLPTVEYAYLKRNLFELYGSASAGVNFARHSEKGYTDLGKLNAQPKASLSTEFAYQVNPIGIRVGNQRIGGFVEAGLGYRGFVTAGMTVGF